jgi:ABC-type cobalt transport system substrate-binding protein
MQPEQRIQVEAVLRDARQQYKNLKLQHRPEFDAVRESARGKIRSLLNAEQQARFDQYVKELDAKREAARQAETVAK